MKKLTYEESVEKLENIVDQLEEGNISLDESLKLFEQGIELSTHCNKLLQEVEKKITILINQDGEIKEEGFEAE